MVDKLLAKGSNEFQSADEYEVFRFMSYFEQDARTEWLMQFYKWIVFHTWTVPKIEVAPGDTGMRKLHTFEIF